MSASAASTSDAVPTILRVDKRRALAKSADKRATTWAASFDPSRNQVACYVAAAPTSSSGRPSTSFKAPDADIIFATYSEPIYSRRGLITNSYIVFSRLQQYAARNTPPRDRTRIFAEIPPAHVLSQYSGSASIYRAALRDHLFSLKKEQEVDYDELAQGSSMLSIFHIAQIVHLPSDGVGDSIVSEELLDWINQTDPAPTTSDGEELLNVEKPFQHPNFWLYIYTATLRGLTNVAAAMLETLSKYPNHHIKTLVISVGELFKTIPRSTSFSLESSFVQSFRSWKKNVQKCRSEIRKMAKDIDSTADPSSNDHMESFFHLLAILDGDKDVILEEAGEWKTALGAWALYVQPELRRDNLPDVMMPLLETLPYDQTDPAETAQASFVSSDLPKAVQALDQFDPWLAAHLTDLLDKVGIIDQPAEASTTLREWFLLNYCDYIHADPGLWRISMDYLSYCGPIGYARMRQIVYHVPLSFDANDDTPSKDPNMEEASQSLKDNDEIDAEVKTVVDASTEIANFQDLLKACKQYSLTEEAITICRMAAESLVRQGRFGLAMAFCYHIGDARRVAKITETLLDQYIYQGPEVFKKLVDQIPRRLFDPSTTSRVFATEETELDNEGWDGEDGIVMDGFELGGASAIIGDERTTTAGQSLCVSRLLFLAKFRDYLEIYNRENLSDALAILVELLPLAPHRFRAALLLDCIPILQDKSVTAFTDDIYEILRVLQDVVDPIHANSGRDIYGDLGVILHLVKFSSSSSSKPGTENATSMKIKSFKTAANEPSEIDQKKEIQECLKQLDVLRYVAAKKLAECIQAEI